MQGLEELRTTAPTVMVTPTGRVKRARHGRFLLALGVLALGAALAGGGCAASGSDSGGETGADDSSTEPGAESPAQTQEGVCADFDTGYRCWGFFTDCGYLSA